jgi:hypothetical protein
MIAGQADRRKPEFAFRTCAANMNMRQLIAFIGNKNENEISRFSNWLACYMFCFLPYRVFFPHSQAPAWE